jgi:hypothetical protein
MGLCKSKHSKKYNDKKQNELQMENVKPKIKYLNLSQPHQVHEAVLSAYINKKSDPEKGGVIFMRRNDKSHITLRLMPGSAPSDDQDAIDQEILVICRLIEDHFIEIGVNYEIYVDRKIEEQGCYKLYCHIFDRT